MLKQHRVRTGFRKRFSGGDKNMLFDEKLPTKNFTENDYLNFLNFSLNYYYFLVLKQARCLNLQLKIDT